MKHRIKNLRRWFILVVSMVTLVLVALFYYRWQAARSASDWVRHSHRVRNHIHIISARVRDLQIGHHGFLITGDSETLQPYWQAVGRNRIPGSRVPAESTSLLDDVRILDSLVSDNPRQRAHVSRLRALIIAKIQFTDSALRLQHDSGMAHATRMVQSRMQLYLADTIRGIVEEMAREEDSLLKLRHADSERHLTHNDFMLYGTVSFFYLMGLLSLWLASRNSLQRREAERALKQSNVLLNAVIDGTDYGIMAADANGIMRVFNRGAERMLGHKAEDEIGLPVREAAAKSMLPEEVEQRFRKIVEQYGRPPVDMELFLLPLDSDGPYGQEWTYVRKDGSRIAVAQSVSLLEDGSSVAIVRDITRIKRLERDLQESSARLQAVIDGIDYAIFAADERGILRLINKGTERILGYSVDEMVGRPVTELAARFANADELRGRASRLAQHYGRQVSEMEIISLPLPNDGPFGQEWTYKRPDGTPITLAFSVYSLKDSAGRSTGVVALARDITQIKALERMKNEFVSTVSHELRTPLTSIRGALGLVAGGAAGALPDKAAELVSIAHRNSERLVRIINDILDVEKIESGKLSMNLAPVDAGLLMRQAVETHASYGEKYGVRFVLKGVPDNLQVLADGDRLMQVLANLMSNAAKFSPPGAEVWLKAEVLPAKARFTVQDFGTGIPDAFRSRVFEKFAQAENTDARRYDGTGLGLNITRKLVEAMHGSIGFETQEGKGTTFTFDVPLAFPVAADAPGDSEDSENRILICEDDRDVAALLKIMLERAGFSADAAFSLAEARALLEKKTYAALTLDLMLPDGSGVNLLRELRADPRWVDLAVIVVSAKAEQGRLELNGDAIGMIDWLVKPIDENLLVRSLRRAVAGARGHKPRILHVEDDADLSHILGQALQESAEWVAASTVHEAEALLSSQRFDLIVLDLELPDGSGLRVLERLHEIAGRPVPVLILSASETGEDVRRRVEAALVKSRMSEGRIVDTILTLIRRHSETGREKT